jgi:hypothetical protein
MATNKYLDAENLRTRKMQGMSERQATMVSLKRTAKEKKASSPQVSKPYAGEDYPYNSRLDLDHDMLNKLGMTKLPAVGHKVKVMAHGHVSSASMNHDSDGGKRRNVTIQLTHMKVHGGKAAPMDDGDEDD